VKTFQENRPCYRQGRFKRSIAEVGLADCTAGSIATAIFRLWVRNKEDARRGTSNWQLNIAKINSRCPSPCPLCLCG
jgi:hypothetical protein